MIKQEIIKQLYKKYPIKDRNNNEIDLKLFDKDCLEHHSLKIIGDNLTINSVDEDSPFREIPLKNIAGLQEFDHHLAIVLRNSILFLGKNNDEIHVHINMEQPSIWQRLKFLLSNEDI